MVSWSVEGSIWANLDAATSPEKLLALADTVTEATTSEWAAALAKDVQPGPPDPTQATLVDGTLDDGTAWALASDAKPSGAACHTVVLNSGDIHVGSCISNDSKGPFRMAKATDAKGAPIVFGITSITSEDSNVIRILDATGAEVGQDTTTDQTALDGRAFAIPLDPTAKGPFTVELYDFDREWYVASSDSREGDLPYLKPGSPLLATATVSIEK